MFLAFVRYSYTSAAAKLQSALSVKGMALAFESSLGSLLRFIATYHLNSDNTWLILKLHSRTSDFTTLTSHNFKFTNDIALKFLNAIEQ